MAKKPGLYVYCVIPDASRQQFGFSALGGKQQPVYTIPCKDMAMVVSQAPRKIYTPTKVNVFAHQQVISKVMKSYPVIPMNFGNVFSSEDDIRYLMDHLYDEFFLLFPRLHNRIEVGLKLVGKKAWLEQEIEKDSAIADLKEQVKNKSEASALYDRMKLGEHASLFIDGLRKAVEDEVFEPLAQLSDAAKQNEPSDPRILLNAAFLIDRDNEASFDKEVSELYEQWSAKAEFKYTGPWPPYNFINIRLKIEGDSR
jgi:uncharacterized protein YacL (UPF0231 family)